MKKILVVLLVLAVATGVFAQEGEWSFNGTAEIGAAINFDPAPASDEPVKVIAGPMHYNRLYDDYDGIKGKFGITYNRDVFAAGLTIQSIAWEGDAHSYVGAYAGPSLIGTLTADGENYHFSVESALTEIIDGRPGFRQLWGNYSFMNGVFFLETAYARGWTGNYWASDTVGAFRRWDGEGDNIIGGDPFRGSIHARNTFTHTDAENNADGYNGDSSANYILGDIRLQGLSFGLMMRDIFRMDWWDDASYGQQYADNLIVDSVLKKMIFGVKFEMSPIEVAAQFLMENYGVYVGGRWFVGPVTVGLSFMGILNEKVVDTIDTITVDGVDYATKVNYESTDATKMKVGGGVDYEADSFGAAIKAFFAIQGYDNVGRVTEIGVEPGFYYNVIPSHLRFQLNTGFYFYGYKDKDGEKVTDGVNTVQYALQPQLFWNFLGTGAGEYGGTGIVLRYRLVGGDAKKDPLIPLNNKFDVNFKYSF
jgi:hypothetical protein